MRLLLMNIMERNVHDVLQKIGVAMKIEIETTLVLALHFGCPDAA